VRKRTKKSGIIYCLVTSHPPQKGGRVTNRPILGSQTPNSWSPAGEGEFEGIPAFPAQTPDSLKPGQFGA
jgi:hypothetical protein